MFIVTGHSKYGLIMYLLFYRNLHYPEINIEETRCDLNAQMVTIYSDNAKKGKVFININ